jgi:beta-glucanase (GH16 family)
VDSSNGSWPAIWLLGTEDYWPDCGEIDIMELYCIKEEPQILANVAWGSSTAHQGEWDSSTTKLDHFLSKDPKWVEKFHTWAMKWDEKAIQLFLDGELLNEIPLHKTVNPNGVNPFTSNQNFYLLLNLAIGSNGGDPSNSRFPMTFEVDYVRVYKQLN